MDISRFMDIIWDYTKKISENTQSLVSPLCEENGLTIIQARALIQLHKAESHTIGSLAECMQAAGGNMSSMCKKLESMGLLERIRSKDDERVVRVMLTDQGRHVVKRIGSSLEKQVSEYIVNETEETLCNILYGLQKLNELLERIQSGQNK